MRFFQSTYTTDQLPKDIAASLLTGLGGALLGGLLTCLEATQEFDREYPHDGQNGLGGFYFGALSARIFGLLTAGIVFTSDTAAFGD